jgi:hypothetical protein
MACLQVALALYWSISRVRRFAKSFSEWKGQYGTEKVVQVPE